LVQFLHAFHEAVDTETRRNGEVWELVWEIGILAQELVKLVQLANLGTLVELSSFLALSSRRRLTIPKYRITFSAVSIIPSTSLPCSMKPILLLKVMSPKKSQAKYDSQSAISHVFPALSASINRCSSSEQKARMVSSISGPSLTASLYE
jgi:hypothetical protein